MVWASPQWSWIPLKSPLLSGTGKITLCFTHAETNYSQHGCHTQSCENNSDPVALVHKNKLHLYEQSWRRQQTKSKTIKVTRVSKHQSTVWPHSVFSRQRRNKSLCTIVWFSCVSLTNYSVFGQHMLPVTTDDYCMIIKWCRRLSFKVQYCWFWVKKGGKLNSSDLTEVNLWVVPPQVVDMVDQTNL